MRQFVSLAEQFEEKRTDSGLVIYMSANHATEKQNV